MQKTYILLLLTTAILAFSTAHAENKVSYEGSDVSLEEQPFVMPSYNQFRKMSDQKQMAYLHEVREMLGDLTKKGVELSFFDRLNINAMAKWTAFLSLLSKDASADTNWCSSYTFSDSSSGVCVTSASGGQTCGKSDGAVMTQYVKNCPTKFAAGAPDSWKTTKDSKSKQYIAQTDVANDKAAADQAAETAKYKAKEDADNARDKAKADAAANPSAGGAPTPAVAPTVPTNPQYAKPQFPSTSTANTNQDKKAKKFRCIYAGFTIYGDKCSPQTKYVDPKTNSVYTCAPTAGDKDYGIIAPTKIDSKKSILCNPIFFGTVAGTGSNGTYAKQEPICVAKGKNATADCLKAANKNKDASLKSAVKFAKDDKAKYQELTDTVTKLCQPAGAFTTDSGLSASSKKDLESTCKQYRERMFDYAQTYGAETSSGVRAGPSASIPGAQ